MIKIIIRKNLIYLLLLFISYFLRRVLMIIIEKLYEMQATLLFSFLMVFGQIFGGAIISIYQATFLRKKKKTQTRFVLKLINNKVKINRTDGWEKIILLIFFASFFDLIEFIILAYYIPKIASISSTISLRLCCIITIASSLICTFTLRFKIGKHQKLSLLVLGISSILIIILENIYKPGEMKQGSLLYSHILLFFHFLFLSFTDVVERYLADYDYLNPLQILMLEGIFSFIITSIYSINENPFKEITRIYNKESVGSFTVLIFLLILYSMFSAGINIYKIMCNVMYSPMTKSLTSYFLNWAFIIYYYAIGNDFLIDGKSNFLYFFMNLILSILIDFFGLIYNELFILYFCGLEKETHYEISERAISFEVELFDKKLENINEDDNNTCQSD